MIEGGLYQKHPITSPPKNPSGATTAAPEEETGCCCILWHPTHRFQHSLPKSTILCFRCLLASIEETGCDVAKWECAVLIVGKEGADSYLDSTSVNPKTIIEIQARDARLTFTTTVQMTQQSYGHFTVGLTAPEEKWIATCWIRSEALTGPFSF